MPPQILELKFKLNFKLSSRAYLGLHVAGHVRDGGGQQELQGEEHVLHG
jgi:hypothetical protein